MIQCHLKGIFVTKINDGPEQKSDDKRRKKKKWNEKPFIISRPIINECFHFIWR